MNEGDVYFWHIYWKWQKCIINVNINVKYFLNNYLEKALKTEWARSAEDLQQITVTSEWPLAVLLSDLQVEMTGTQPEVLVCVSIWSQIICELCIWVCVPRWVHICACICVWRLEVDSGFFHYYLPFYFLRQGLSLSLGAGVSGSVRLVVSEHQRCFHFLGTRVTDICPVPGSLCNCWEPELKSPRLCGKHFITWAIASEAAPCETLCYKYVYRKRCS